MNRIAILLAHNNHFSTLIMVDRNDAKIILPYIMAENIEKEFREIKGILLENMRNQEKYRKVNVSEKAADVFEMRFIKGDRNDRIYCKELRLSGKRFIVMVELLIGKKSQKIPKNIKTRIETIGGYSYDLEY